MSASPAIKLVQLFAGLGSVATTPFAIQFANKHINEPLGEGTKERIIGKQEVVKLEVEQKELERGEVMTEIKKMLGRKKGEPRCAWLPNQQWGLELLICAYENKLESTYLFHYDSRNQLGQGKRVKQIEQITFASGPSTVKFINEKAISVKGVLRLYLTTLFRKKNVTLVPESHCQISGERGNYQFTCSDSNNVEKREIGRIELETLHQNKHTTLAR